jgi:hypothetical protein
VNDGAGVLYEPGQALIATDKVARDHLEARALVRLGEEQLRPCREIVEDSHGVPSGQQGVGEVRADEPGPACDDDRLAHRRVWCRLRRAAMGEPND